MTINPPTGTTDGVRLYAHQRRLLDELPRRKALVWETGTGKSLAAIACANRYPGARSLLVVCPKGLVPKWERDLRRYASLPWFVLSKEQFKKGSPTCSVVVFDEGHHHLGLTSQLSKATVAYGKRPGVVATLVLTATPYRSSPWDVYTLYAVLGRPLAYWDFRRRFFYDVRMGGRTVPKVREAMLPRLREMIAAVASVVRLDECADVPEQVHETVAVARTAAQERALAQLDAWEPLLRCVREHQIMGGCAEDGPVETAKDDALRELLAANPRAVVVAKYREEMARLERDVLAPLGRPYGVIHGDVPGPARDATLTRLRAEPEFVLLVNAETVEGWELPEASLMVFYSHSWKLVSHVQALGRIQRLGHVKRNAYVSLVVAGTVDEAIHDAIVGKADFHAEIYSKHRKSDADR